MRQSISTKATQAERMCRTGRRRPMSWKEFFPHARIINDPQKLAELNVEIEKRKQAHSKAINIPTGRLEQCRKIV